MQMSASNLAIPQCLLPFAGRIMDADAHEYTPVNHWIEQFGEATVSFARLVVCEHCGEVPRSDKSQFRQCSCQRTRLLPAKM